MDKLHLEGSFRLSYNGSLFVKEGLGYLLTFEHLIDTNPESGLVFRPLTPKLETKIYLGPAEKTHIGTRTEGNGKRVQANAPAGGWRSWPG